MRPAWWGLLFAVVCMPLVFVLFLIFAAKHPAMDALTLKLPNGVRTAVSELAFNNTGFGKQEAVQLDRVIKLDPASSDAWSRRCTLFITSNVQDDKRQSGLAACQKAVMLDPTAWKINSLGLAHERAKDFCTAEDSFTSAIQKSSNNPHFIRNMARAALRCGHLLASGAGFEVAEDLDAKDAADPDDDGDAKVNLALDREYLAVIYDKSNEPEKAAAACERAHPTWKNCHCDLSDTDVTCSGGPKESSRKK